MRWVGTLERLDAWDKAPYALVHVLNDVHDSLGGHLQVFVVRELLHDGSQQQRILAQPLHWLDQQATDGLASVLLEIT